MKLRTLEPTCLLLAIQTKNVASNRISYEVVYKLHINIVSRAGDIVISNQYVEVGINQKHDAFDIYTTDMIVGSWRINTVERLLDVLLGILCMVCQFQYHEYLTTCYQMPECTLNSSKAAVSLFF